MYVGVVFLIYHSLELVRGKRGIDRAGIGQGSRRHHTLGHCHAGQHILLVALGNVEGELERGLEHLRRVVVHHGDCHSAAILIIDDGGVATHLLTLERIGLGADLSPLETEIGGHGDLGVFHEKLRRDTGGNGGRHTVACHFQRIGIHREIIGLELVELLAATGQHHQGGACGKRETRKAV